MADPSANFHEEQVMRPHLDAILACAISPDGSLIATGSRDQSARLIDATTGKFIYTAQYDSSVLGVAWHSDGDRFVSTCFNGTLTEFTRSNGSWSHHSVHNQKHRASIVCCAVSANGLVAIGSPNNCVVILDSNSNYSVNQTITGLAHLSVNLVSFSSNGSLLAIGCNDGTHYVYGQLQSNGQYEQLTKRKQHLQGISSLSFSPSDSYLIIGSGDNTASLWNVPSSPMDSSTWPHSPSFVLKGHTSAVYGTCFSGDVRHVITGSCDDTIRIWRMIDGGHVDTIQSKCSVASLSFHSPTGRLFAGLRDGSLHSWICPPYVPITVPSFVDVHLRLSNAQKDISDIESKLSLIDPSVWDAIERAARIRNEIDRLQQLIDEHNVELFLIETDAMKEAFKTISSLEEQLQFAKGEIVICNRIIDHVTECYNNDGYFSSLQSGAFFDQWLFDSGLGHMTGKLKEMDGDKLVHMSVYDLLESGLSYNDACDIHIRACMTAHMQTVGSLPGVFSWNKDDVSTWLQSQGPTYASLVSLGWTGPSLLALSPNRIESSSNKKIRSDQARALKEAITSLIKDDTNLPKWLRKWTGGIAVADYANFI